MANVTDRCEFLPEERLLTRRQGQAPLPSISIVALAG
jgi:hypothetical protein